MSGSHVMTLPLVFQALLLAAALVASWSDAFRRRIPNWLCLVTALAGLSFAALSGGAWALGSHALHASIALVAGMILFALGGIGGGDAKFYTAVATWFALAQAILLLLAVSLSGLVIFIVWFVYRRAAGKPIRWSSRDPGDGLPYGIPIALGTLVAYWVAL
ncbi:MAG: prepilin peptidase [Novosphingobium sp.]|jgi:prepilin peptidase CpaA|nr:prepilin peptidase [Novosphingobium sp.]